MRRFATIIETVPTPCRVFGTALRPFSLGHHILMARLGLPFADNPKSSSTTEQLLQSVFLCAHSYEDNLEGHLSGEWLQEYQKWAEKVAKKGLFDTARPIFSEHLEDGYRIAPVWRTGKSGLTFSAPWEQLLKCRLVANGFSQREVMNGYLPQLWYDYFTILEMTQAENCADPAKWQQIFYTYKDAIDDEAANALPIQQEVKPT